MNIRWTSNLTTEEQLAKAKANLERAQGRCTDINGVDNDVRDAEYNLHYWQEKYRKENPTLFEFDRKKTIASPTLAQPKAEKNTAPSLFTTKASEKISEKPSRKTSSSVFTSKSGKKASEKASGKTSSQVRNNSKKKASDELSNAYKKMKIEGETVEYEVKKGDSLWKLAKQYLIDSGNEKPSNKEIMTLTMQIAGSNKGKLKSANTIVPGQKIIMPKLAQTPKEEIPAEPPSKDPLKPEVLEQQSAKKTAEKVEVLEEKVPEEYEEDKSMGGHFIDPQERPSGYFD